mmetsp:Transcript_16189/g.56590  ORF Transcript_16189/g.56590 Transcript_16189/m.56590 type:complete len:330 (-) Transcript_16189:135-1124(-)
MPSRPRSMPSRPSHLRRAVERPRRRDGAAVVRRGCEARRRQGSVVARVADSRVVDVDVVGRLDEARPPQRRERRQRRRGQRRRCSEGDEQIIRAPRPEALCRGADRVAVAVQRDAHKGRGGAPDGGPPRLEETRPLRTRRGDGMAPRRRRRRRRRGGGGAPRPSERPLGAVSPLGVAGAAPGAEARSERAAPLFGEGRAPAQGVAAELHLRGAALGRLRLRSRLRPGQKVRRDDASGGRLLPHALAALGYQSVLENSVRRRQQKQAVRVGAAFVRVEARRDQLGRDIMPDFGRGVPPQHGPSRRRPLNRPNRGGGCVWREGREDRRLDA